MSWVDKFKLWGRITHPVGKLEDGPLTDALKVDNAIIIVLDSDGRMYQLFNAKVSGATMHHIGSPRAELSKILDDFNFPLDEDEPPKITLDY